MIGQTQPELETLRAEVATLRQVNSELVAKAAKRKDRVCELEAALTEKANQLSAIDGQLKAIQIDAPLKQMAESLSIDVPIFLDTFSKQYDVQLVDGSLAMRDKEGNVIRDRAGNEVRFERESLLKHLSDEKHLHSKLYSRLLIASRASGGGTAAQSGHAQSPKKFPAHQFGLR